MTQKSENTAATATTPSTEKTAAERAERASDVVERAAGLSDEVLKSVESGGRAAIGAVRKFVDTVDGGAARNRRPPNAAQNHR
jgi:hypothetical protein